LINKANNTNSLTIKVRELPLVIEARKRAFPHTQKALDVFKVLESYLHKNNVVIKTGMGVSKINTQDGKVVSVLAGSILYTADSFILATGGMSHPETGSTGDGFNWLKTLGHTVKDASPNIVPLAVSNAWIKSLPGVSLSFMKITFFVDGKKAFSKTGKILFTHFGLSGPLILNSAAKVKDLLYSGHVTATIDAYPDTDLGALDTHITKLFTANKNKTFKNILPDITPAGTAEAIATLLPSIPLSTKVHSITKEMRKELVNLLKALPVSITGLMGFDRAVVSDGGVVLSEIDTKTMRSKKYANLYMTGDLLHINRPSGGYSLQLCWTTGFVAGNHV
jgi:predicted Rossmann fold flavoprotein